MNAHACALCREDGGEPIWRDERLRIVAVRDAAFPAYYRVIWNAHVAEFSGLGRADREACIDAVVGVETLLLRHLGPTKVNIASLGNVVPHLHWHVIGRFAWDACFPQPIWAPPLRSADPDALRRVLAALPALEAELRARPW